jgi:hypothetical protein
MIENLRAEPVIMPLSYTAFLPLLIGLPVLGGALMSQTRFKSVYLLIVLIMASASFLIAYRWIFTCLDDDEMHVWQ